MKRCIKLPPILLCLLLFIAGGGTAFSKKFVTIQLDWIYNAQFAGLYQAIEQGYLKEFDLEVTLLEAPKSVGVVESLTDSDDLRFGVSESSVLLGKRREGHPIVALAPMFQTSPMGWMHLPKSNIQSVKDFKGKRIGIHADGLKILGIALAKHDLSLDDIHFVEVGYDPAVLIKGQIELMQAYYIDEFVELQRRTDNAGHIELAGQNGYLAYSQVLFTTEAMIESQAEIVVAVTEACRKGWAYALDHKEATIDLILSKWNPEINRDYQLASLEKIEQLVRPENSKIMPWPSIEKWQAMQELLLEYDLLPSPVDLSEFVYQP
ncbi:ABC transporter substrate-binding protein [Opitutia bacterium ISCC 51]|nr:ABC transporter substrate-binding protein [Opitutae bacterium ISCC 51]QXD27549.1 ABC transporter substrate-binding protein [Opitutae bacterium ISCC 52]